MQTLRLGSKMTVLTAIMLTLFLAAGCGSESSNGPNDSTAPTVNFTSPTNSSVGGATTASVAATFSEVMMPSTLSAATFSVRHGATVVPGVVTYTGSTATFTPAADLIANTVYSATISTGAEDLAGNALGTDYNWSFTTGALGQPGKRVKQTQRWTALEPCDLSHNVVQVIAS